jgi:hypothetical protein
MAAEKIKAWWGVGEKDVAGAVNSLLTAIHLDQSAHQQNLLRCFRLYGNFESAGMGAGNYTQANFGRNNRLTVNVIKSCADTIVARIGKTLPKPTFLTSGGRWSEQKKAKLLDKLTQGIFYQTGFRKTAPRVLRDAVVFGKGFVHIFEDARKRVCIERVFPGEIIVDEMEAIEGKPRQMHRVKVVARELLLGMFPEEKGNAERERVRNAIANAATATGSQWMNRFDAADLVNVIESWHLPSTVPPEIDAGDLADAREKSEKDFGEAERKLFMKGHDGRHALSVAGAEQDSAAVTLVIDAWRDETFPFVDMDWCGGPLRGWWPTGLPIELCGFQFDINKISRKIKESVDWLVPKAFVEAGSKVTLSHLDDVSGGIIRYTGTMPQIQTLGRLAPELLQEIERNVRMAYEQSGVNQLASAGKKPPGLQSGASLREYDEFQSERFATVQSEYQDFTIAVAAQCISLVRRITARDGSYAVSVPTRRKAMQTVDFADIELDDNDFIMQCFPSNSLPRTPAGRLAMVQDLINMGYLDKEDSLRLLDFPDVEAVNQLAEAAAEFTSWQLERILDGHDELPEPFQNLEYSLKRAIEQYLFAKTMDDIGERELQGLRNYMLACKEMMKAARDAEMQAQAMASMGGGAPPAPGTTPPGAPPAGGPPGAPPPMLSGGLQ